MLKCIDCGQFLQYQQLRVYTVIDLVKSVVYTDLILIFALHFVVFDYHFECVCGFVYFIYDEHDVGEF